MTGGKREGSGRKPSPPALAEYREKPSGKINKCLNCPEVNNKFRLPCDPVECGGKGVCTQ